MYNRKYDRVFIMLEEEMGGYGAGGKHPCGNCTIEIRNQKGKLAVYVQDLQRAAKGIYYVYLIACEKGEVLGVRSVLLEVDASGRGTVKWEFEPENVGQSGISIDAFSMIAVMEKGSNSSMPVPLCGYRDEKMPWRNRFREWEPPLESRDSQKPPEKEKEEMILTVAEAQVLEREEEVLEAETAAEKQNGQTEKQKVQEETVKPPEKAAEVKQKEEKKFAVAEDFYGDYRKIAIQNPHDTFRTIARQFQEEIDELEAAGILSMEEVKRVRDTVFAKNEEKKEKLKKQQQEEWTVEDLLHKEERLKPFGEEKGWNWVRMLAEELVLLPFPSLKLKNHPFVVSCYHDYKHMILGEKKNTSQLFLGLPDRYDPDEKERAERLGFQEFRSVESGKTHAGSYGYWLLPFQKTDCR